MKMNDKAKVIPATAATETGNERKVMLGIINVFIGNGWTYKDAIKFLPEIESVLNEMSVSRRITKD